MLEVVWHKHGRAELALESLTENQTFSRYAEYRPEPGTLNVIVDGTQTTLRKPIYDASDIEDGAASGSVRAPINGRVAKLFVTAGAAVAKGDKIAVVEAMKMEHVITAAVAGTIDKVAVSEGAQVTQGTLLAHIVE